MRIDLSKALKKFRRSESGATLVEYGIALILAIAVGGTLLTNLATAVQTQMTDAADQMTGT
ncbi:pilus assembly protein Flp/PilA [Rhodovulum iodosum]|uniref:Pilus assembly protein Flp/PilA n=1 Tax=Rhodovulum iodosum TaxID=68291 RepID=A0ABV3XWJ5_9RHOB|nr:Flp family type IVb pilin [Rhodovulum robiginosum]RSK34198.1 Flp family type IVb pilin [Rhodovulum robiginosum]